MKHTQGKWEVRQKVDKKGRKELCWEVTCKTNVPKMRGFIATVGYKPNAELIAAAPELLEACKEALTELERQLYKTNISEEKDILSIKIGSLKQAIAKAEEK